MKTDTIAAIATALSESGIGIIRISGEDAAEIVRLRTSLAEKENKIKLLEDELQKAKAALEDQTKRLKEIAKLAKIKE